MNEEMGAIGHPVAHQKIHHGGHTEIDQDLHQRIDLVLAPHGAELQKGKACMHGQYHDRAQQNEQRIDALFRCKRPHY